MICYDDDDGDSCGAAPDDDNNDDNITPLLEVPFVTDIHDS